MARTLNPQTICNLYTATEILAKIKIYEEALEGAVTKYYMHDSTQGNQKVEAAEMDKIESVLSVYMKAYELKTGQGKPRIVNVNFGGHV